MINVFTCHGGEKVGTRRRVGGTTEENVKILQPPEYRSQSSTIGTKSHLVVEKQRKKQRKKERKTQRQKDRDRQRQGQKDTRRIKK